MFQNNLKVNVDKIHSREAGDHEIVKITTAKKIDSCNSKNKL